LCGVRQHPDLRNAEVVAPVLTFTREDIDRTGASNAEQFMATLPQTFGGGQNGDTALKITGLGNNASFGTAVNLRGLGSAVAQGEVVPDRFVMRRDGTLVEIAPGRKDRVVRASGDGPRPQAVARDLVDAPCLDADQAVALARLTMSAEDLLGGPVEVEWALGDEGLQILQARPLRVETPHGDYEPWRRHPGLRGQPAGVGWAQTSDTARGIAKQVVYSIRRTATQIYSEKSHPSQDLRQLMFGDTDKVVLSRHGAIIGIEGVGYVIGESDGAIVRQIVRNQT